MPSMVPISWPSASAASIRQEQTRQPAVERDAAGAAIAGRTAFLGAGQAERPAQRIEHGVVGFAQELGRLAVDGGGDVDLGHELNSLPRVSPRSRPCASTYAGTFC